jgi:heme/copper-type cytochrome/quinol oxidase subunit 3
MNKIHQNALGMLVFIGSESVFFAALILSYAFYRTFPDQGPTPQGSLNPLFTGFFSLFLFSSSFTMWQASRSLTQQKPRRMAAWILATMLLGFIFLVGQGIEWARLILGGTTISSNLFTSTFFTLTGFHGAHVILGLFILGTVFGLTLSGQYKGPKSSGVEAASIYWHFVDGVWVVIYSVIYLTIVFGVFQ